MLTRINVKNNDELSILGFGCMRLPNKNSTTDEINAIKMIHDAIEQGVNYFDTAYVYQMGKKRNFAWQGFGGGLSGAGKNSH